MRSLALPIVLLALSPLACRKSPEIPAQTTHAGAVAAAQAAPESAVVDTPVATNPANAGDSSAAAASGPADSAKAAKSDTLKSDTLGRAADSLAHLTAGKGAV